MVYYGASLRTVLTCIITQREPQKILLERWSMQEEHGIIRRMLFSTLRDMLLPLVTEVMINVYLIAIRWSLVKNGNAGFAI